MPSETGSCYFSRTWPSADHILGRSSLHKHPPPNPPPPSPSSTSLHQPSPPTPPSPPLPSPVPLNPSTTPCASPTPHSELLAQLESLFDTVHAGGGIDGGFFDEGGVGGGGRWRLSRCQPSKTIRRLHPRGSLPTSDSRQPACPVSSSKTPSPAHPSNPPPASIKTHPASPPLNIMITPQIPTDLHRLVVLGGDDFLGEGLVVV